jgi:glycosyltransferase involved in cell wall biosynthesis
MSKPIICTIIAKNYLAAARCLTDSFLEYHPDGQVFVLVIDEIDGYFEQAQECFTTVRIEDVGIKDFWIMIHRYSVLELSTAVKPFFLEYLFQQFACEKICYIDPDIYFYQPIDEIWNLLDAYGIVLIPHLLDFLDDKFLPTEFSILQAGCYNLGFIGLAQHAELYKFLHWWQQKLVQHCIVDFERGLFVDQRWIDLVPGLFSSVYVHRDPGCNVGYWNLNHRHIECKDGRYVVNDVPLKFFHFSGFSAERMDVLSKYQDRFTFSNLPTVKPLFEAYRDCLLAHDDTTTKQWPYTYDYHPVLDVKLPSVAHIIWREWESHHPDENLFDTASYERFITDFMTWLNQPIEAKTPTQPIITRLAWSIYQRRRDLKQLYPDVLDKDRQQFIRWFLVWAKTEYKLDEFFIEPMRPQKPATPRAIQTLGAQLYKISTNWLFKIGIGSWLEQRLGERMVAPVRSFFFQPGQASTTREIPALVSPKLSRVSLGLNVIGYMTDETGVGEAARASLKALHLQGFPVTHTTVSSNGYRKNDRSVLDLPTGNPYPFNCFYVNADQAKVVYNELGLKFFRGKHNIGYWHWELGQFPKEWLDRFQYFDEIWVASNFVQNAVAQVSPIPVITIGNHVEKRPNTYVTRSQLGLPTDKFLFLFIFDMFSFIERKNPFGVVEAYRRAFGCQAKNTQLIIKVANLDKFPRHKAPLEQAVQSVSGKLINGYLDRDVLNGLFHVVDAYISLHRSEGFGMTMAEAMRLGKPTIATAYSSNMDFMNIINSYPVGYKLVELAENYGPYRKGQVWADPDLDHAAAQMQQVIENPAEASRIGAQAVADIERLYSSEAIAQKIIQRLEAIASRLQTT